MHFPDRGFVHTLLSTPSLRHCIADLITFLLHLDRASSAVICTTMSGIKCIFAVTDTFLVAHTRALIFMAGQFVRKT